MDLGLKGKIAIVTGGAKGIGKGIVEGFVKEGTNVVIADIDMDSAGELARTLGGDAVKILPVMTDVSKKVDAQNLVYVVMNEFGKIDILVNNAGIGPQQKKFADLREEEWDEVINVNTKGIYLVTRAVIPHMIKAKQGKIVNTSSFAGKEGVGNCAVYTASKFAVTGLTQSLAKELAEYNINVNAVCPGIVRTPLWERYLDILAKGTGRPREEPWEHWVDKCPLKRPQTEQDITNVILFLSSEVSRNITGESINITGGLRMD